MKLQKKNNYQELTKILLKIKGYYERWIRETLNEFERTEETEGLENRFNYAQSGRVLTDLNSNVGSNVDQSETSISNSNLNNNNDDENNLYEPASVINERSNSQIVNGTESDELTISGSSFTQAPTLLNKNSTGIQ